MANYRTSLKLKSYKGWEIERIHKNGEFIYMGYGDGIYDVITAGTLKRLRRKIDQSEKEKGDK